MTRLIALRMDDPEIGWGDWQILETGRSHILGMRYDWEGSVVVLLHSFQSEECPVMLDLPNQVEHLMDIWGDCLYEDIPDGGTEIRLEGYGYRWFRVNDLRKQPHYG